MDEEIEPRRRRLVAAPKQLAKGYAQFISDYNVAPLAIGVVIGTTTNDFVKTLVSGFFTPLISLLAPRQGVQNFQVTVHGATFQIGVIVNSLISFLIILGVVYVVVKVLLRQDQLLKK